MTALLKMLAGTREFSCHFLRLVYAIFIKNTLPVIKV
jgi:hypothetical protein